MTIINAPWLNYAILDDRGFICGLRKDTPEEIKQAYEKHKQEVKNI